MIGYLVDKSLRVIARLSDMLPLYLERDSYLSCDLAHL